MKRRLSMSSSGRRRCRGRVLVGRLGAVDNRSPIHRRSAAGVLVLLCSSKGWHCLLGLLPARAQSVLVQTTTRLFACCITLTI